MSFNELMLLLKPVSMLGTNAQNVCHCTLTLSGILKAARVKFSFELNDKAGKGAYGLDGVMIDAPMYKQALNVLGMAEAAGLPIPEVTEKDVQ